MQIPTAGPVQDTQFGFANPGAAAEPFAALERGGAEMGQTAASGFQVAEKIQAADDFVTLHKAENLLNGDIEKLAESMAQDTDYPTLTARIQARASEVRKKYEDAYGSNPRVWKALEPYLDSRILDVHQVAEAKRLKLLSEDEQFQLRISRDEAQRLMAAAVTPEEREMHRNEFYLKTLSAELTHIITKEQGYALREGLEQDAEKTEVIEGLKSTDLRVISRTLDKIDDPKFFSTLRGRDPDWLADKKMSGERWLDALSEKVQKRADELSVNGAIGEIQSTWTLPDGTIDFAAGRKQLANPEFQKRRGLVDENGNPNRTRIEQVETYLRGFEGKEGEAKKQVHDKFEKDIGNLYLKGDYPGLLKALGNPDSPLTGDETRSWTNSVRERQKQIKDENKDVREAGAIIQANDMIRKGEDPGKIRAFIIQNLTEKGDREQYINKLDNKLSQGIEEGRKQGYADIKDIIFPPARAAGMSVEAMIQTPLQTMAIKIAQMELDAWIDKQVKAGKEDLTVNNIRAKAQQLADQHAPKSKDTLDELNREMQESTKAMSGGRQ